MPPPTQAPGLAYRVTRSVAVAFVALLAVAALGLAATVPSAVHLLAKTALIMSGTFTPDPPPAFVDMAMNQFIRPTHPNTTITPVAVDTPEQAWPVTGLFDLPFGQSLAVGQRNLERAMAEAGNDNLIIFGHSQSSVIAYREKRRLAEQFPDPDTAPDIDFVTIGTLNLPNGGVMTRFWGAYLPFVDFYFNGPLPTDTPFDTHVITQRWDGFADFPIYPINGLSVVNAVFGFFYVHEEYADVTLVPDPNKYKVGTRGDTTYYFFETQNLPLYGPLRSLGVPEPLIDIVEPLSIFAVELGYRRDIKPWVPSPARLIPIHDPAKVVDDFVAAVDQTIDNTRAVLDSPSAGIAGESKTVARQRLAGAAAEPDEQLPVKQSGDENADRDRTAATPQRARPALRGPLGKVVPKIRALLRGGLPSRSQTSSPEDAVTPDLPSSAPSPDASDGQNDDPS